VAFVIVLFMLPSLSTCKILLIGTVALPPLGSSSSSNESLALSTTLLPTKSSIAPRSITLHHSVLAFDSLVNSLLNQWLLVRLLGCIVQLGVRVGFLRPKSWCPIVKSSPSNKRFLNAAQLALEKTDLYGARVLPSMDVYEWRGQGHQNAGAMTEAQILLVTSELLEIAEIAPVEMTAALLAHEFGHFRKHHALRLAQLTTILLAVTETCATMLFPHRRLLQNLMFLVGIFASLEAGGLNWFSRRNEYEADAYASAALGENNMILVLQQVSGVPLSLVKAQHSLGLILLPSRLFRHKNHRYTLFNRVKYFCRTGEWIPRSGAQTHPSLEHRMLRLHQLKKERDETKKKEAEKRKAFFHL